MIRVTTSLETAEIIQALQAQPREVLLEFTQELLLSYADAAMLEEVADIVLAELERRASSG